MERFVDLLIGLAGLSHAVLVFLRCWTLILACGAVALWLRAG